MCTINQPSTSNFPIPGKRPQSSMAPNVFVNSDGDAVLVSGAAGGTTITSTIAWVRRGSIMKQILSDETNNGVEFQFAVHNLFLGLDIKECIDIRRLHHQLSPMVLFYEEDFDEDSLDYLQSIGHIVDDDYPLSVAGAIARLDNGTLRAVSDWRKDGAVDGD